MIKSKILFILSIIFYGITVIGSILNFTFRPDDILLLMIPGISIVMGWVFTIWYLVIINGES